MFIKAFFISGLLLVGISFRLSGQSHLDSAYTLVRHDSRGEVIAVDENEIIVIGAARDSSTAAVGIVFSRFSLNGDLLFKNYHFDGLAYFVSCNELIFQDSIVYVAPHMVWSPRRYILKYNKYTGEIIDTILVRNASYDGNVVIPQGMARLDANRFILTSTIWGGPGNETQISFFNIQYDEVKHLHSAYPGYHQNMYFIEWRDNKIYLVGDLVKGDPDTPDFDKRMTIAILDTMGVELWRYVSLGLRGFVSDCFIEDDGDIVVGHSFYEFI